jgi:hypothetical protein
LTLEQVVDQIIAKLILGNDRHANSNG